MIGDKCRCGRKIVAILTTWVPTRNGVARRDVRYCMRCCDSRGFGQLSDSRLDVRRVEARAIGEVA